jgi:hypothetical protein
MRKILSQFFDDREVLRIAGVFEKTERGLVPGCLVNFSHVPGGASSLMSDWTLIGVRYALPLSYYAGFLEVGSNIGPIISTVPAFIVGVAQSPFLGFTTIALYFYRPAVGKPDHCSLVMSRVSG